MRKDAVTPELREAVLKRDGKCFLRFVDPRHDCFTVYGDWHNSYDLNKLTLDHVHDVAGGVRGKRAPSDERHLVALCGTANMNGVSRTVRQAQREYLKLLYPCPVQ